MPKSRISILVLAAGGASRFGSSKQLLKWKNSNLLKHTLETAISSNACNVSLVLGANYDSILKEIDSNFASVFRNEAWQKGLGNSIAFGVKSVNKVISNVDGVLILLADQPLIKTSYLNNLIDKFECNKEQIIASTYINKKFGVPVIFDACYFNELMKLNDDDGAKTILKKYKSKVTTINQGSRFDDIDTIEDYKRLYDANHQ